MQAAGVYIRTLRDTQKMTQEAVIDRAAAVLGGRKIDLTTLWRIETGRARTRNDILLAVVAAVGGNDQDVAQLMRDPSATKEDGEARALAWLSRDQLARIDRIVEETESEELAAILESVRAEYQRDPRLLAFLRAVLTGWRARGGDDRHG